MSTGGGEAAIPRVSKRSDSVAVSSRRTRVLITGSNGVKLTRELLSTKACDLILIDVQKESKVQYSGVIPRVEYVQADLSQVQAAWTGKLRRSEVVFHFAGCKLNANCDWSDAAKSLEVAGNVLVQAAQANVKRVIIASSWHVIGSCKDSGGTTLTADRDNKISADQPVSAGAQWFAGCRLMDSTSYAVPKLAEERLAKCLAESNPTTSFLVLRMGWCQPEENSPRTLSPVGCEMDAVADGLSLSVHGSRNPLDDSQYLSEWFRNTWLSNRDFCSLCRKCIDASLPTSSKGFYIVNAMSSNRGSRWDLDAGRDLLGYVPHDDASEIPQV